MGDATGELCAEGQPAAPSQPKILAGMGYGAGFARDQAPSKARLDWMSAEEQHRPRWPTPSGESRIGILPQPIKAEQ